MFIFFVYKTASHHGLNAASWLKVLLIGWLTWGVGTALAQDHITERAWMEDTSRQMSWSEVQKQELHPFAGLLSKGFGDSVIWLRLRVDPDMAPKPVLMPERLVLRIRPVYLDNIRVYDPLSPDGLSGVTGDIHPPSHAELQSLNLLVPIARGTEPRDIWLRLDSSSTRQIDVQALNEDSLRQTATRWALEVANEAGPAGWPDADKVFEKYYRSPHARRQTGSGLGLYLVRHLMHALGGLIDYAPSQDRIRFILYLPTSPLRT